MSRKLGHPAPSDSCQPPRRTARRPPRETALRAHRALSGLRPRVRGARRRQRHAARSPPPAIARGHRAPDPDGHEGRGRTLAARRSQPARSQPGHSGGGRHARRPPSAPLPRLLPLATATAIAGVLAVCAGFGYLALHHPNEPAKSRTNRRVASVPDRPAGGVRYRTRRWPFRDRGLSRPRERGDYQPSLRRVPRDCLPGNEQQYHVPEGDVRDAGTPQAGRAEARSRGPAGSAERDPGDDPDAKPTRFQRQPGS